MKLRAWAPWLALVIVVGVAFGVGLHHSGHQSPQAEAASIAGEVRCPTCEGQSAELSDAPAAAAVRQYILQHVEAGQTRGQIEASLRNDYGSDILLKPSASGVVGLVWVLPVIAFVVAIGALVFAFRRWGSAVHEGVTDADRKRVADAIDEETNHGETNHGEKRR